MFWNNTIRKQVMKSLNERIDNSQKNYDEQCKVVDSNFEAQVENLRAEAEMTKAQHLNECVSSVLGPLN